MKPDLKQSETVSYRAFFTVGTGIRYGKFDRWANELKN